VRIYNPTKFYSEDPTERDHLEELNINGGDYIKIYLKEMKEYVIFIIHKNQFPPKLS
jgi:hypothetical protein